MRAGADLRLLRAAVFAAACATLATTGHLAAAGPGIAPWALAAGWLAAFAVAAPLAGRERRSLPALAAALAAGQLTLHVLYCLGQHHTTGPVPPPDGVGKPGGVLAQAARLLCNDHAAHLTEADALRIVTEAGPDPATGTATAAAASGAPGAHAAGLADAVASLGSAPMLLGHLLAALAAAWLLRRGDAALWQLVRLSARRPADALTAVWQTLFHVLRRALRLTRALLAGDPRAGTAVSRPPRTGHHPTPPTCGTAVRHAVTRRGPPPAATRHQQFVLAA